VPSVDATYISGSSTAADNVQVVYDTDFATCYDTTADTWKVDLADDAITASKYDESTAFPLASADSG